ncbi:5-methylcytosine-specific restriction endonuclease system specificity protein McrC, partial [Staphylococcus aureus]|nr:5-methylcytosine-specific restriction endonuclease system specificity protein McrC [Staphylococcus aureus]
YDTRKIHSANLYQIFTYVKNQELYLKDEGTKVSGMLLYAGTDEGYILNNSFCMSGNNIHVRTLDLNSDFANISRQLNEIVKEILIKK